MQRRTHVRSPAVAGTFYPGDPATLERDVEELLRDAAPANVSVPKALVVPHAGYVYSGPIAASAYACLRPARTRIRRVVLLGPSHRVPLRGGAIPDADGFATPLGSIPLDRGALERLATLPGVVRSNAPHAAEHSLEVQLPFLQRVLDRFELVPLSLGHASPDVVANVLEEVWGGDETLVLISSDLSHYLPYDVAQAVDRKTVDSIVALTPAPIDHDCACGATSLNGMVRVARTRGLRPTLLDLRNSGDTAGSRSGVVGYAAIAFHG